MEPEREPQEQGAPVGFLFGNVDEKNRLEADYLDEVRHFITRDCSAAAWPGRQPD
jgi:hypothetical protein